MKICFIPIDDRPVCYNLAKDICAIDKGIELFIPPREFLGNLIKPSNIDKIIDWMKKINFDVMILSLDTLVYGGLIPSRRITESLEQIKIRANKILPLIKGKKVYAFSSIMRISNNNYNEEEKEYWKDWGKKIFEFSYKYDKDGILPQSDIPNYIIDDYIKTRNRNFEINKLYLEWQKEGLFDVLIFSKDDCAEFGFNVREARELENLGGKIKTGADEIPLMLLARAIEKEIKVYPIYTEPKYKDCISNYEDISIEKSVLGQLELGGFKVVNSEKEADIVLVVNNFIKKQGELVMGWETQPFKNEFILPENPYAVADVRYANGADNEFIKYIFASELPEFGYSGWNTSANSLGSLLAALKVKYNAKDYSEENYKKLQVIRYLDDWAYQANIRGQINSTSDITKLMKPYEKILSEQLNIPIKAKYSYPWNRKFEIEISLY